MFSVFTQVMKPVRDTNSESGLPVVRLLETKGENDKSEKKIDSI